MFWTLLATASDTILLSKVKTNEAPLISVSHFSSKVSSPSSPVIHDHLLILVVYPEMNARAIQSAFSAPYSSIKDFAAF